MLVPHYRRFFLSERWGGYAQRGWDVEIVHNPYVLPLVIVAWFASAVALILGWWTVWAALLNLLLCRYFFVRMRWRGVLRGFGAPGFMTYWLAAAVFLLEYSNHYAPQLAGLALLVIQVDLALIMLSSGVYKVTAGYPRNYGMELGMVNPEWGYWWRLYKRMSPDHWLFRVLNQLAWSTEVAIAVTGLIPATRQLAAVLLIVSFAFIGTQIRLGMLCPIVVVSALVFVERGTFLDRAIAGAIQLPTAIEPAMSVPVWCNIALAVWLWSYLALLPLAHAGLFFNFYGRRRLPGLIQVVLEKYTNFYGIIIWRVFSVDHTNFFIRIYRELKGTGERQLLTKWDLSGGFRYSNVGEAITVTTLFTTLKYYPSNSAIFADRLLRYARTMPYRPDSVFIFEHVSVAKSPGAYVFTPIAEFRVDTHDNTVEETSLTTTLSPRDAHAVSPIFEGGRPGSYAPLAQ